MQLGRKVVLGGVGGEEHRVLGNSMELKTKTTTKTKLQYFLSSQSWLLCHSDINLELEGQGLLSAHLSRSYLKEKSHLWLRAFVLASDQLMIESCPCLA